MHSYYPVYTFISEGNELPRRASTSCQVESIEPAMSSVPTSRAQSLFKMIKMGAPNNQFHAWMDHVTCWYNGLADDEKNEVLETLISASGVGFLSIGPCMLCIYYLYLC